MKHVYGLVLVFAAACGGDDASTAGGSATSCDDTKNGTHGCSDYVSNNSTLVAATALACTQVGNTVVKSCDKTGIVAGCKTAAGAGTLTATTTVWFYSGTVASVTAACSSPGMVVMP